ncbi:hypothetical protein AB0I53_26870 [Saccharopolyspora sp. NPDC050389]|uniref:hypothetical protein n=1 Tax=Saccharopolyspora sp. NPDC050389 TaxID=3155516 RepID=UPI003400626E
MLEIADKLGSVLSALIGLIGLGLTVYGFRLQRRATRPAASPPIANAPLPSDPTGLPQSGPVRLEVPDRSAWVPSSEYLPPGQSTGTDQGFGYPPMQQPYVPGQAAPRRTVLVIGLVLLAVAIVLGVATWIL